MFCRNCGDSIPVDSVFCPTCGKNLLEVETQVDQIHTSDPAPRRRFFSRGSQTVAAISDEDGWSGDEPGPSTPAFTVSVLERLGFQQLFWVMGLLFSVVGFIVGMTGSTRTAIVWILFGLVLLVAAPHAPESRRPDPPEQEEASD